MGNFSSEDERMMRAAMAEAAMALADGEVPVGAVIVSKGRIIAKGHNMTDQLHDPTAHAELLCMRHGAEQKGDWRLNDCTLYVTLEPCPMCAGAMVMSRVGRCVFGAGDPEKGCCGSVYDLPADPALHSRTRWRHDTAYERECKALLESFFQGRREDASGS